MVCTRVLNLVLIGRASLSTLARETTWGKVVSWCDCNEKCCLHQLSTITHALPQICIGPVCIPVAALYGILPVVYLLWDKILSFLSYFFPSLAPKKKPSKTLEEETKVGPGCIEMDPGIEPAYDLVHMSRLYVAIAVTGRAGAGESSKIGSWNRRRAC